MKIELSRRNFLQLTGASATLSSSMPSWGFLASSSLSALSGAPPRPVVFWATDGVQPSDIVMALGGSLQDVQDVRVWPLDDSNCGNPQDAPVAPPVEAARVRVLQPNADSLKFQLPASWKQGVYGFQAGSAPAVLLNRPLLWFIQPTRLLPGLGEDEVAAGIEVQIVGKDFLLPDDSGSATIAIRPAGGAWRKIQPSKSERYALTARLPADLADGSYDLSIHNGSGGPAGWSPLHSFTVKKPEQWPQQRWNVREHGALGDDVHDDSEVVRSLLAKAEANGGGILYFPWGTYRLSGSLVIPPRVVFEGEEREATILKWPANLPASVSDFSPAAILTASQFGLQNLTIIARNFDTTLCDLSAVPHPDAHPEAHTFLRFLKPWPQYRDVFIRHVRFEQWLDAGRPPITGDLAMNKKFYSTDECFNVRIAGCRNFEVSDCVFQGGSNQFMGLRNGRVVRNSFSNSMNYCWTTLGGGAHRLVCSDNEIHASSSFGYGTIGLQYVYVARNVSHNFVRGEREAMTFDVSAMPTARSMADYWGTPIEVSNEAARVQLRFPPASAPANADGFRTGFVPGSFRGGIATVHTGEASGSESRKILDNTEDSVTLDVPFKTAPSTTPQPMYIELQARKNRAGTAAWVGDLRSSADSTLTASPTNPWVPNEFIGDVVLVLTGKGAGQYRAVRSNTENQVTLEHRWDVEPEPGAAIGIWALTRHVVFYKCQGFDTSCFAQLWGSGYDFVVDSCHVERSQGVWGQSGWFVQIRNTTSAYGYSYHKGIGPHGPTPEGNSPYALVGFNSGSLRLTKFGTMQYPVEGGSIFVDKLMGRPIPGGRAVVLRRNHLLWNERLVLGSATNHAAPVRFIDAVIDGNLVEHSETGVQIGADVERVLAAGNRFADVQHPYGLGREDAVLVLKS
jgi:hypothetical protein